MTLDTNIIEALGKPIDPSRVQQRQGGGGKSLSYIASHDAIATANEVFGYGGWSTEVTDLTLLGEEDVKRDDRTGFRVGYRATVRVTIGPPNAPACTFSDTGYGDSIEYTKSRITPHELASKEAVSDAVKRCLRNFGTQFGLSLYSEDGRAEVAAARQQLDALPALKREVYELAVATLGTEKPTQAAVAKVFGVKTADLQQLDVLRKIVAEHG